MKGTWILPVAVVAVALLWLRRREDPAVAPPPDRIETIAAVDTPPSQPEVARSAVQVPEPPPIPVVPETEPDAEAKAPAAPEPTPEWINEARFVEAGLLREQAVVLVDRLRDWHRFRQAIEATDTNDPLRLYSLMLGKLGPTLADRIKDGSISFQWTPWPQRADWVSGQGFPSGGTPATNARWSYSPRGRFGALTLEIPWKICDKVLVEQFAARNDDK